MTSFRAAIQRGFRTLLPSCQQVARLQSDLLDQPLPLARRFGLRLHLLLCGWCRRYGKHLRLLRRAAHEHEEALHESAPHELSPEARAKMKRALRESEMP